MIVCLLYTSSVFCLNLFTIMESFYHYHTHTRTLRLIVISSISIATLFFSSNIFRRFPSDRKKKEFELGLQKGQYI